MTDHKREALVERVAEAMFEQYAFAKAAPTTQEYYRILARAAVRIAYAAGQAEMRERAAQTIEGNHLLSGSIGPLMNIGWGEANRNGSAVIRKLPLASGETPP